MTKAFSIEELFITDTRGHKRRAHPTWLPLLLAQLAQPDAQHQHADQQCVCRRADSRDDNGRDHRRKCHSIGTVRIHALGEITQLRVIA